MILKLPIFRQSLSRQMPSHARIPVKYSRPAAWGIDENKIKNLVVPYTGTCPVLNNPRSCPHTKPLDHSRPVTHSLYRVIDRYNPPLVIHQFPQGSGLRSR